MWLEKLCGYQAVGKQTAKKHVCEEVKLSELLRTLPNGHPFLLVAQE